MKAESTLERMLKLGSERFQSLLQRNGGVYSVSEVAARLNLSVASIIEMAAARQLISVEVEGERVFPTAQFNGDKLIPGVRDIMNAFRKDFHDVTVVLFFLCQYEGMGQSPLELLRQDFPVENLIRSAASLYEHGAR